MTDAEQQAEAHRRFSEQFEQQQQQQRRLQKEIMEARRFAHLSQQEINNQPRQKYACIVAVDERGAFSKDGKIPWNYPEDFKWFQAKTKGHICVMGRATYDDIVATLGERANDSVLPGRKCFVVTSTPLPKNNATAVATISDVDKLLSRDDVNKTVFFCGGERIYREGIAKCDELLITIVNKDVDGDRRFPTTYVQKYFDMVQVFKNDTSPDLRFTVWKRKQ